MSSEPKIPPAVPPVITAELATQLAREAESLRREYRQRVEAMWTISKDERQTRSR